MPPGRLRVSPILSCAETPKRSACKGLPEETLARFKGFYNLNHICIGFTWTWESFVKARDAGIIGPPPSPSSLPSQNMFFLFVLFF